MAGYDFAPGITACRPDKQLILLDLPNDRYFALTPENDAALCRLIARESIAGAAEASIMQLAAQGVLTVAPDARSPALCERGISPTGAVASGNHQARQWQTAGAVAAVLRARVALRVRGFAREIHRLQSARVSSRSIDRRHLEAIASSFRAASAFVSPLDHCLPHSLALARCLFRRGIDSRLIVGVSVQPFRAHCWVQAGDQLLIDELDAVRQFTPILIV